MDPTPLGQCIAEMKAAMSRDPKYDTPEREPIVFDPAHQARIDADREHAKASHAAGMEQVLADAEGTSRRIAAQWGLAPDGSDVYGEHCVNCEAEWCLPADRATCPHKAICETCWPNGCDVCAAEVEAGLRRREEQAARILNAALELRTGADDLSEADMAMLDWRTRRDIQRHIALTTEALFRVRDMMNAQDAASPL
jgi:hypothetical protein